MWRLRTAVIAATIGIAVASARAGVTRQPPRLDGGALYREHCASCHGLDARGDGPDAAALAAPPRNLRDGLLTRYPVEELVQRLREGKPLELALDPQALRAQATQVEALVGYLQRLPTIQWNRVAAGEEVYAARCVLCHGLYGRPGPHLPAGVRPPRDLSDGQFQGSLTDEELNAAVRHGRKTMPALVPRVTDAQARSLAMYVRLLSPGFELYSRYCESCHGADGHGAGSLTEALPAPTVVFNTAYFARHDAEQLRASVWHMAREQQPRMPHYRSVLSVAQARAIVTYLRKTE